MPAAHTANTNKTHAAIRAKRLYRLVRIYYSNLTMYNYRVRTL